MNALGASLLSDPIQGVGSNLQSTTWHWRRLSMKLSSSYYIGPPHFFLLKFKLLIKKFNSNFIVYRSVGAMPRSGEACLTLGRLRVQYWAVTDVSLSGGKKKNICCKLCTSVRKGIQSVNIQLHSVAPTPSQ